MDRHVLSPLFSPRSLVVFAGPDDDPAACTPEARLLREALAAAPGPQQVPRSTCTSAPRARWASWPGPVPTWR